jgi:hypothetical protein
MNSVGPVIVEKWIDNPNGSSSGGRIISVTQLISCAVTALVWSGLAGQEAGKRRP